MEMYRKKSFNEVIKTVGGQIRECDTGGIKFGVECDGGKGIFHGIVGGKMSDMIC